MASQSRVLVSEIAESADARRRNEATETNGVGYSVFSSLALTACVGALVSGFWHVRVVDGLGLATFVTPIVGPFEGMAATFDTRGAPFGFLFALLAGLAATWTASNVAMLALVPLLTSAASGRVRNALRLGLVMTATAMTFGLFYGLFVGRLGPAGAEAFNASPIRSAQSFAVFSAIGFGLICWALFEARVISPSPSPLRTLLATPVARAVLCGVVAGACAIGRPLAVFREAILYAAQPGLASYAAAVVAVAVLGTVVIPWLAVVGLSSLLGAESSQDGDSDGSPVVASVLGGAGVFLLFYWGFSRVWPALGRWGFTMGFYS